MQATIPEYRIDVALLDSLRCDFVAHGDDLPIRTDGTGMYHESIAANRFRMIKRTEGVSTTTFIGRLLAATRSKTLEAGATNHWLVPSSAQVFPFLRDVVVVESTNSRALLDHHIEPRLERANRDPDSHGATAHNAEMLNIPRMRVFQTRNFTTRHETRAKSRSLLNVIFFSS